MKILWFLIKLRKFVYTYFFSIKIDILYYLRLRKYEIYEGAKYGEY